MMYKYILVTFIFSIPVFTHAVSGEADKDAMRPSQITWGHVEGLLNLMSLELTEEETLKERRIYETQQLGDYRTLQKLDSARLRTYPGVAGHQLKGFGPEAAIFYAAIGGNMAIGSYINSITKGGRSDPRWMENLLYEMTSPVGVFSFFCFVMVSGQVNLLYSRLLSPGWDARFKRGPFKGRRIIKTNPWFSPGMLSGYLDALRLDATLHRVVKRYGGPGVPHNRVSTTLKYHNARFGPLSPNFGLFFAGPLGMSAGMLASNIVHELDYIRLYNPHVGPCWDSFTGKEGTIDSEDGKLHCDLFWDKMGSTIISWAPGLASLVTASVLSHAAVNAAYGLVGGTIKGAQHLGASQVGQNILKNWAKRAGVRVPWAMLANAASLVPTPATTGVKAGAKGLGLGVKAIAQWIKGFLLRPGTQMAGGKRAGGIGFRFINLLAFMLTDTWLTHGFYSEVWTETIKADDVSDGMRDFITYNNVDSDTPAKVKEGTIDPCDGVDESDCEYHESIFSAYKTALTFDRWRQFRLEKAAASWQNWFKYVSSTTGSFEQIYDLYKMLFQTKWKRNSVNDVNYFGGFSEEGLFSGDAGFVPKEDTPRARSVFEGMLNQINQHTGQSNINIPNPSDVALDVVSDSPYHFLKPEVNVNIDEEDRLFVLGSLFSVIDPRIPLEPFYGEGWGKALRKEEEKIYKYENPDEVVKEHFARLEEATQSLRETALTGLSGGTLSLRKAVLEAIKQYLDSYLELILNPSISSLQEKIKEGPINSNGRENLNDYVDYVNNKGEVLYEKDQEIRSESLKIVAQQKGLGWNHQFDINSFIRHSESFISLYFEAWLQWLALEKDKIFSKGVLVDVAAVTEAAQTRLRKKTLSAGLEYLNTIIKWERNKYAGTNVTYIPIDLQRKIKDLPPEMLGVYHKLGTDNIFAQLYAKTFVLNKIASEEDHATEDRAQPYIQIKPETQGMSLVRHINTFYHSKEESYDVNYHPDRLLGLSTNGFMDFVIASAVCGPDPLEIEQLTDEERAGLLENQDKPLKDIIKSVPLFNSFIGINLIAGNGASYAFYPPRITTLDELTRKTICRGFYSPNRIERDIYNGRFPVGDKVYNNLLHLVLDHIGFKDGETEVSSLEDFDKWWSEKIAPYMIFFNKASDQEYKRIVKHDFMGPLFMKDIEDTTMVSYLQTGSSNLHNVHFSDTSEWDDISQLSKAGFTKDKRLYTNYDARVGTVRPLTVYNISLPKGIFDSMHFEALYWSDMILHFARKRGLSDTRKGRLEEALKQFAEGFNISECAFSEDVSLWSADRLSCHIEWARGFLKSQDQEVESGETRQHLDNLLKNDIAEALDIDVSSLIGRANPDEDEVANQSLSMEEQKERREKAISAFKCEPNTFGCDLPLHLLNFFIIRLNQILTEATVYADQVGYISKHSDVQKINEPISW